MDLYARIFEFTPDALLVTDSEGGIAMANAQAAQMFGYRREELIGRQVELLIPARFATRHVASRQGYAAAPHLRPMGAGTKLFGRRRDASEFPVDIMLGPLETPEKALVLCVVRDVSERQWAEAARFRLAAIVESAADAIIDKDLDGVVVSWNPAAERLFGYSAAEAVGRNVSMLIPPEFADEEVRILQRIRAGERVEAHETVRRRKDGSSIDVWLSTSPVKDARGTVIGASKIVRDITERKLIERDLADSESRLAGIVDTAMDAIVTIDAGQRVVVFNRAAEKMFQTTAAEAVGSSLDRFIPQRLREAHRVRVEQYAVYGTTTRTMGSKRELVGLRSDGQEFPLEVSLSRTGEGDRLLMTASLRDLTGVREAQLALERQRAAEAASRAKTEFLSRMSHELRTPLNAVLGFSQLLQMQSREKLSPRQAGEIEHIRQAGLHLTALIDDLLDISRIEMGSLQVELGEVDLIDVLDQAVLMAQRLADTSGIRLEPRYRETAVARVQANAFRLRQVMINLLTNAIKYNHRGGTVSIDVPPSAAPVQVEVSDTGMGMTHDQLERLFVPFERLGREASGVEGSGIGLALTRQLLNLMSGTIQVQSEPGVGTTFRVSLRPADAGSGAD